MKYFTILTMACSLFLFSCGDGGQSPSTSSDEITIGMMPKLIGIDYFNACEQGAIEAGKELGINVVFDGPTTDDVSKQMEMVESWMIRKFDAICVAPNDREAFGPMFEKVKQRGIYALSWDAEAAERDVHVNMTRSEMIGQSLVDLAAAATGGSGEYAIVTGRLTTANQNAWIKIMRDYIAASHPGLVEVALKTSEEDQALATQVTGDLLKTYPNLKAIFAITSVALPGAAQAVEEAGAGERVFLTGLSSPKSMKQYIDRGVLKQFVLWSPVDLGYLTIHTAYRMVKGLPVDEPFEAGRLGMVEVDGTEVILGNPMVFDKDNIDDFDF